MTPRSETRTIGKVARITGLSEKAIRIYESKGLIATAHRSGAGYRQFDDDDIAVLGFICRSRALGLRLEEIKEILDLQRGGRRPCGQVLRLVDAHIKEIDGTVTDLKALKRSLLGVRKAAAEDGNGSHAAVCPIIEAADLP